MDTQVHPGGRALSEHTARKVGISVQVRLQLGEVIRNPANLHGTNGGVKITDQTMKTLVTLRGPAGER